MSSGSDTFLVVHFKHDLYDDHIGRSSRWDSPFALTPKGTIDDVIDFYEQRLLDPPEPMAAVGDLAQNMLANGVPRIASIARS